MIKCRNTKEGVEIEMVGRPLTIMTELCAIIKTIRKSFSEKIGQEEVDDMIRENIRMAFMDEEELCKETEEKKKKLVGIIRDEDAVRKLLEILCG